MSKYRIYDLAKENHISSKEVLDILAKNNIKDVKSHSSTVGDAEKAVLLKALAAKSNPQPKSEPKVRTASAAVKPAQGKQEKQEKQEREGGEQPRRRNRRAHERPQQANKNKPEKKEQEKSSKNGVQNAAGGQRRSGNAGGGGGNKNGENKSANGRNHNRGEKRQDGEGRKQARGGGNGSGTRRENNNRDGAGANGSRENRTVSRPAASGGRSRAGGNKNSGGQTQNRSGGQGGRKTNGGNANRTGGALNNLRRQSPGAKKQSVQNKKNQKQVKPAKPEKVRPSTIQLGEKISVKELAGKMGYEVSEIIKKLMMLGVMATINQEIDFDTASLIASEFSVTVEELPPEHDPTEIPEIEDDPRTLVLRPPVVTVMGHVDHGKTSLLDVIRKTHVTSREAGGITQHIGAYQAICQKKKIVFLDTPGHEAFTAMRARGAQITDIAVLVVAADDGVMPQTIEAINHAKSAQVPIIVAINKIDREGANPEHVKQQLSEYGLISEEWGGDTVMVEVSAKKQIGIDNLLEMILIVAEVQDLKANPNRAAEGVIIEAQLDKGRGPVATVLVQKGTLRIGDSIIAGTAYGKVRAMINDRGEQVKKAAPSMPVEVLGLNDVPEAGDVLNAVEEKVARSVAEKRIAKKRSEEMTPVQKVSLDTLFEQIKEGEIKNLNIVVKADVQGSVEAINGSLLALNEKSEEVRVEIVHSGVGAVNETDIMLASASNALIIAFNVRPDANARKVAEAENIDIRTYRVIYEAINDVKAAMSGMLAPQYKEVVQGHVEIRQVMSFSKVLVAGSYVLDGKVTNSSKLRLLRDNVVVYEGAIESLRRFKDDVKEVAAGYECGITLENYRDIKEGDIMEIYTMEEIQQTVD